MPVLDAQGDELEVPYSVPTHLVAQWGPVVALLPFAPWWLKPPPEHGLATMLRHLVWPRLLDPDRLASYQCMRIADGALHTGQGERCLTVWRLPQVNLAVASVSAKRRHRAQWGAFLDGLGHEVTIVVRARKPIDGPFSTQRSHASAIFRTSALLTS